MICQLMLFSGFLPSSFTSWGSPISSLDELSCSEGTRYPSPGGHREREAMDEIDPRLEQHFASSTYSNDPPWLPGFISNSCKSLSKRK